MCAVLVCCVFGAQAPAADGPRFTVRSFDIEGELPIPRERALAVLAPFSGDAVDLAQLQSAAAALETELVARGHSFYRVVLPPQQLQGSAIVRVLPFRLANVSVSGNRHFSTQNVLASLPALKQGESPNIFAIARNRAAANDHAAKHVEVTFRQSETPDAVEADVAVRDTPPQTVFASLNNTGERRTGNWRASIGYQHSNLWNRDHSVTASYTTSPDHLHEVKQYGLYYRIPFYAVGGALTLFYAHSDVSSGTIANAFQVSGRGNFAGVHWKQHLVPVGAYSHAIEAGIDDRLFRNDVVFGTTQLGVDVRSRPVSLAYSGRYDRAASVLAAGVQYSRNIHGGSDNTDAAYTANRAGASSGWDAWRYNVDGAWRIAPVTLNVRLRGQYADDPLIPGEQFGMGGASSVRGLREREVTGDSGVTLAVEGVAPLPWEGFSALAFVDGGQVRSRNVQAGQIARDTAASVGVGVRWSVARRVSVAIDAAQVLDGTIRSERGDRRVHASLVVQF